MRSAIFLALSVAGAAIAGSTNQTTTETPHTRKYFYAGGHYVADSDGDHTRTDQIYVEQLTPVGGATKANPIVFIHGQAQTGTNWLNKADGSPGWSSYFLGQGYQVFIVDQTYRGRSPTTPGLKTSAYSAEVLQQRFTAPKQYMLWPQAAAHTQWPGNGTQGDAYFDDYYASTVPFYKGEAAVQQTTFQSAGAALLDRIGVPAVLVAHSQGGLMPWLLADVRPDLVRSIVSLEPTGPPFREAVFSTTESRAYGLTDAPLTYDPPVSDPAVDLVQHVTRGNATAGISDCVLQSPNSTVRRLVNLEKIPTVVLTTEASYHVPYDWCTVKFLQQAGVPTDHLFLPNIGITGNAHMLFLEKNSDETAAAINDWIVSH
ncbi:alpha beta-hydrolase [Diplodia corticola]|uniref:Alpha beta-hydrolase n=1 Tax=Diplodia corticola TaxID=236234 RepID=A0A1J9QMK7_9PEZI|nr:alpha beta-hydrolase [Diplodia corticola]OJD29712.1 alpha beta-hydrolase [Diplodia corticola]